MTIRCVAIDDEPLALDVIDKFCQRIGGIELSTFSDPVKGLEMIRREKPAIAFLDIEMENITGLDIASQLPEETCFIFTTAYLNYAMEGFELDAVDYLQAVCLQPFQDRLCPGHAPARDRGHGG